jgi:hypothetical protein
MPAGDKLQLQGLCAFDAAVHCASLSSKATASSAASTASTSTSSSSSGSATGPNKLGLFGKLMSKLLHRSDSGAACI